MHRSNVVLNRDGSVYHLNLKPKHISNKIILVGDPGRVHRVTRHFDDVEFEMNQREFITQTGKYKGEDITVISTGTGGNNLEIVMVELDLLMNYDFKTNQFKDDMRELQIVRLSTSGSIQSDIKLGEIMYCRYAIGLGTLMSFYELPQSDEERHLSSEIKKQFNFNFDPYCSHASPKLVDRYKTGFREGMVLSCPGYYMPMGRLTRLKNTYPNYLERMQRFHFNNTWVTHMDMETASLYAMGSILGHHTITLHIITHNRVTGEELKNVNKQIDVAIDHALNDLLMN